MNMEPAIRFMEKLSNDPDMQKRMEVVLENATNPLHAAVAFAIGEGFPVTAESLNAAREKMTGGLSDKDLELVSAGFDPQPEPPGKASISKSGQFYDPNLSSKLFRW